MKLSSEFNLKEVEQCIDFVKWVAAHTNGEWEEKPLDWDTKRNGDWDCPLTRDEYVVERAKNIIQAARTLVVFPIWDYDDENEVVYQ